MELLHSYQRGHLPIPFILRQLLQSVAAVLPHGLHQLLNLLQQLPYLTFHVSQPRLLDDEHLLHPDDSNPRILHLLGPLLDPSLPLPRLLLHGREAFLLFLDGVPFLGELLPFFVELQLLLIECLLHGDLLLLPLLQELLQLVQLQFLIGQLLLLGILLLDLLDQCHLLFIQVRLLSRQSRRSLFQLSCLLFESLLALLDLLLQRSEFAHFLLNTIELAPLF